MKSLKSNKFLNLLGVMVVILILFFINKSGKKQVWGSDIDSQEKILQANKEGKVLSEKELTGNEDPVVEAVEEKKEVKLQSRYYRAENNRLTYPVQKKVPREVVEGKVYPQPLFKKKAVGVTGALSVNQFTTSAIEIDFSHEQVKEFLASDSEGFSFPLTEDYDATVLVERHIARGEWTDSLIGKLENEPNSQVVLVMHDDVLSGSVAIYDRNVHFDISAAGNGDFAVRLIDSDRFTDSCGNPEIASSDTSSNNPHQSAIAEDEVESTNVLSEEVTEVIDSVIGYGKEARTREGGIAAIEAKIIASAERTNEAFRNSLINNVYYNLRATIEDPDYTHPGRLGNSMSSNDELGDLANEGDGSLDVISQLRRTVGADHMGLVVADAAGSAGIAGLNNNSMIVARTYMTSTRITFVHELGHNIGCKHSWGDSSGDTSKTLNNYGLRIKGNDGRQYRTIMAYDWGWQRIPYFSNPDVFYLGARTGTVDGYDVTGDDSVDPRYLNGGLDTDLNLGSGFDGSNPSLGANNASTVRNNASVLAGNLSAVYALVLTRENGTNMPSDNAHYFLTKGREDTLQETITIDNLTEQRVNVMDFTLAGSSMGSFQISSPLSSNLAPGESTSFILSHSNSLSNNESTFTLSYLNQSESYNLVSSPWFALEQFGQLEKTFSDSDGDDFDWRILFGSTRSPVTGPNRAFEGEFYAYVESSAPNFPAKSTFLEFDYDLSGTLSPKLHFYYHMYGFSMGDLHVDVYDGQWTQSLFTLSGQQQANSEEAWKKATVDLAAYADKGNVKVRFRAITANDYAGDISIDFVHLEASRAPSGYAAWVVENILEGEEAVVSANPQNDGISNIIKYAFNLDPNQTVYTGSAVLTPSTGNKGIPFVKAPEAETETMSVEFVRRRNSIDLDYEVQFSGDLINWQKVSGTETVTTIDDEWERVVVEDILMLSEFERRFTRVQISF